MFTSVFGVLANIIADPAVQFVLGRVCLATAGEKQTSKQTHTHTRFA